MIRIILVTIYSLAACLVALVGKAQASGSFSLGGRLSASFEGAAVFVYTERETCLDSTMVRNGQFHCSPAVTGPLPALLTLQLKSKNNYGADTILLSREFFPMAGEKIQLDGAGLPGRAIVSGSSLQHELDEYHAYMQSDGIGPDLQMLPPRIRSFILIHPDYWISLVKFRDLVLSGSITKPETRLLEFSPSLLRSDLGQSVRAAIRSEEMKLEPGKIAPDFAALTPDGKTLHLSDLRGRYVLLDFWASWCHPCRMENPNVVENYERYKDKNFTVLSFSLDANRQAWLRAIKDDHLDWYHASDLKFWHSDIVQTYMIPSVPKSFLIDPSGKIIAIDLRGSELGAELQKILN